MNSPKENTFQFVIKEFNPLHDLNGIANNEDSVIANTIKHTVRGAILATLVVTLNGDDPTVATLLIGSALDLSQYTLRRTFVS